MSDSTSALSRETIGQLLELGDQDFLNELFSAYTEDATRRVAALEQALDVDEEEIHKIAHALKGASRNLGAMGMGDLCEKMEEATALDVSVRQTLFQEIQGELDRIQKEIDEILSDAVS